MAAHLRSDVSDDGLTIMFEHCNARSHYSDLSSGRSSPSQSSAPHTPTDQLSSYPLEDASEDSWNLIPYDVPWGPEYYHYRTGTLPGPAGACLFLRSPTPLKNRRTQKACNKCRQRKAKCTGTRPTCSRCVARGYICEYVEEAKRPSHNAGRSGARQARERRDPSEEPSDDAEYSSAEGDSPSPCAPQLFAPRPLKLEEPDYATPDLIYPDSADTSDTASSSAEYHSPWEDATYHAEAPYVYNSPAESFGEPRVGEYFESPVYVADTDMTPYHAQPAYFPQGSSQHPAAAVHAPRPVRCTGSPSFLSPQAQHARLASSCEAPLFAHDSDMLINMSPAAEPSSQIAIPQLPSMQSAELAAVHGGAVGYAHPQEMYYYPAPMPQYPFLQYQYAVTGYLPAPQENLESAMLYTMVQVPTGMAS
ncbi:hypothetical protein TRAPUB_6639 [Trametes pubescens]|uniref:Zn(2)-C6 fungal-type domain-containing protein n=1 Tax=Trametes pubescens TaxID=154538 RepID=A0A1M2V5D1_TRAPU|nr:hypothetical protein TRAPUB_6639 [Trametes pubescens]